MPSYAYATKLPGCASDGPLPASDNDGFDTENEEPEASYGRDSGRDTAMQQDDLGGRSKHWPKMNNSINGLTEIDEEAYFGSRCRQVSFSHFRMAHILTPFLLKTDSGRSDD